MTEPDPYLVSCPICSAPPGQPCEDVDGGWVTQQLIAHLYRVSIAAEVID